MGSESLNDLELTTELAVSELLDLLREQGMQNADNQLANMSRLCRTGSFLK